MLFLTHPCEFRMGLLLDSGGFRAWEEGLGLLCWAVVSPSGLRLGADVGASPPVTADLATDST